MKSLVADDDRLCTQVIESILRDYGHVDFANNGKLAVEACRLSYVLNEPYDLVCLDIQMPGEDGIEVLRQIRSMESKQKKKNIQRMKIVMITSSEDPQIIANAVNNGCDGYFPKPVDVAVLRDKLAKLGLI